MRGLGLTVLFCLVVLGFFGLVALERYSYTSWEAYVQVRTWEFCTVIILMAVFSVVGAVMNLYDWCHSWWFSRKYRNRNSSGGAFQPYRRVK